MKDKKYLWLFDADLQLMDCNEAVIALTNKTRAQLLGRPITTFLANANPKSELKQFKQLIKKGPSFNVEMAIYSSKKGIVQLLSNVSKMGNGFALMGHEIGQEKGPMKLLPDDRLDMDIIIQKSSDILMLIDLKGKILYTNRVLPGYTLEQVIGSSAYDYQSTEGTNIMRKSFEKVLKTRKSDSYEISSTFFEGETLYFNSSVAPVIRAGAIVAFAVTTRNKTAIKKLIQEAQIDKNKYLELLRHTGTVGFIQDKTLKYTSVFNPNPAFKETDVLGKTDNELLEDGNNIQALKELKLKVLKTGMPIRTDVETVIDGVSFYYDLMINPLFDLSGKVNGIRGISYDITKYKETIFKIEKAEIVGKKAMIEGEEKERQRIAADLHDAINPLLSTTKLTLESLKRMLKQTGDVVAVKIDNAIDLLNKSMDEVKVIVNNLSPPVLKDFGLPLALSELCEKISETGDLQVTFDKHGLNHRFDEKLEKTLFRIAQELLHNVIKHANASFVELQLMQHSRSIVLMIIDDGKGINQNKDASFKEGYGFKNIKNRIAAFEGKIEVDSTIGKGTIITIELPT